MHGQNHIKRVPALERKAVRGGWIKLRNKELHFFTKFYSDEQIKVDEVGGACGTYWKEGGKAIMGFAGKNHELNFPPRILRHRWYYGNTV